MLESLLLAEESQIDTEVSQVVCVLNRIDEYRKPNNLLSGQQVEHNLVQLLRRASFLIKFLVSNIAPFRIGKEIKIIEAVLIVSEGPIVSVSIQSMI